MFAVDMKPRGTSIIYAPEIAIDLGIDSSNLLYFTWDYGSTALRTYTDEESKPDPIRNKYKPSEIRDKIIKEKALSNKGRPPLTDTKHWYNKIQKLKREWHVI